MTVDYSRNYYFSKQDIEANKPPDKPVNEQLNIISNSDDIGFYVPNEKGNDSTVLNYYFQGSSDNSVVISPYEKNQFIFIITNYLYSEKKLKELTKAFCNWVEDKINGLLHNIPSPSTAIKVLINPNVSDITLSLNSNTRGVFVFDYSDANVTGLAHYAELELADSLELKKFVQILKDKKCKSIALGIFSQQIQNSLNDVYATEQLHKLVTSSSEEISLLLLPLASKPIEHKMNFEIIACIEFISELLTNNYGANNNLISAQEIIANRMREERPNKMNVIPQACAIFLGYQHSKIEGVSSTNIQERVDGKAFEKTGLNQLDDVIEQARSNGKFSRGCCGDIEGVIYNYIRKTEQMCNLIVRYCPEYRELFFSIVLSMHDNSFIDKKRGEINKDWILRLWNSYNKETNLDYMDILGKETLSYPGGGPAAQRAYVSGFAKGLEDLNKESKCKGSQLILREISNDFDKARKKYKDMVNRLRNGHISNLASKKDQEILVLLLLDARIASKIVSLLGQVGSVRHAPTHTTVDTSFAKGYQELYVDEKDKRTLNVPTLRATINNLGDLIGNVMGDKLPRGKLGVTDHAVKHSLKWWVE
tara:strand:- start:1019 stop:2794 length:1776 start_codon:yes stop_codon:yes gene_type:complete